jgi:hypothetical protein
MTTYYRGDTSRPEPPALTVGTWLTPDADVACWYGAAHRYDIDEPRVLDLTALGVGDGERFGGEDRTALLNALIDAGIEQEDADRFAMDRPWVEFYQVMEQPDFLAACAAAGYDLVTGMQWHADRGDEPYEAAIVCREI